MKRIIVVLLFSFSSVLAYSQSILGGKVTGNFQMDIQASKEDSIIGAEKVYEKLLSNENYVNKAPQNVVEKDKEVILKGL